MHRGSNSNGFILNSGDFLREATNRCSQQRREQGNHALITHAFEIDTGYFHTSQDHRSLYFNFEVVQFKTTDRNASMPSDVFYIPNFPIGQLSGL